MARGLVLEKEINATVAKENGRLSQGRSISYSPTRETGSYAINAFRKSKEGWANENNFVDNNSLHN